jgi:hypothetical protein
MRTQIERLQANRFFQSKRDRISRREQDEEIRAALYRNVVSTISDRLERGLNTQVR